MEQFTMVIYGEDLEIDKMQWRELDERLEKMKYNGELKLLIYMFILMILIAVLLGWYNGVLK